MNSERIVKWVNDYVYELLVIFTVVWVFGFGVDDSSSRTFSGFLVFLGVLRILKTWLENRRKSKRTSSGEPVKMRK